MCVMAYLQDGIGNVEDLDADVDTQEVVAIETSPKQTAVSRQSVLGSPAAIISCWTTRQPLTPQVPVNLYTVHMIAPDIYY